LEIGCSVGVFSRMLADRCEELLAVDIAELAVRRARERLGNLAHVRVERREIPHDMPAGPFDAIVIADVMYYWTLDVARLGAQRMAAALAPGGALVALHWRLTNSSELTGDPMHDLLHGELHDLHHVLDWGVHRYRLDRWDRPATAEGHRAD
jgi:predicted TPR repeat methyltransferase